MPDGSSAHGMALPQCTGRDRQQRFPECRGEARGYTRGFAIQQIRPVLSGQNPGAGRPCAFVRFKLRGLAAVQDEVLPPALAFWTSHFLPLVDDVAFSVADNTDHFTTLASQHPRKRRALECGFRSLPGHFSRFRWLYCPGRCPPIKHSLMNFFSASRKSSSE
jgi:hypothetical protein